MFNNTACIYDTKHQAMCINVLAEQDRTQILVGTSSVRHENELHLLQYNEEPNEIRCTAIFDHPGEVCDLQPSLKDSSLLFTVHVNANGKKQATCWRLTIPPTTNEGAMKSSGFRSPQRETKSNLDSLTCLPMEDSEIQRILWDLSEETNRIASIHNEWIKVWSLDPSGSDLKEISKIHFGEKKNKHIYGAKWDPHNPQQIAMTLDENICGWDLRSSKPSFTIPNSHSLCVRDVDYNPNKPYYLCSGGDDCRVKFWDCRNPSAPLKTVSDHSHWVWGVKYNRYHDQLVLSSSSDGIVNLWRMSSISSAPLLEFDEVNMNSDMEDIKIRSYSEHEESVYDIVWGTCDSWVFASLSYDGRVVVNHVPSTEKYKILL